MKKFYQDNKGISLVELIVGMAILGVVVIPLLNAFFTSAMVTSRNYKTGNITTIANNMSEKIDSIDLTRIIAEPKLLWNSASVTASIEGGNDAGSLVAQSDAAFNNQLPYYKMVYSGLDYNGEVYDVTVTLDGTQHAQAVNSLEMTSISKMDGFYAQIEGDSNFDKQAEDWISTQSNDELKYGAYLPELVDKNREIILDVARIIDNGKEFVEATLTYEYDYEYKYIDPNTENIPSVGADAPDEADPDSDLDSDTLLTYAELEDEDVSILHINYNSSDPLNEAGCKYAVDIFATPYEVIDEVYPTVYLCYQPFYDGGAGTDEVITVNNLDGIPVKVVLVKQKSTTINSEKEGNYKLQVDLRQPYTPAVGSAQILTNAGDNLIIDGADDGNKPDFRYFKGLGYVPETLDSNLVTLQAINRLYNVQIDIAQNGVILHSLTAQKLR